MSIGNRVTFFEDGSLEQIVTDGGAHLEAMGFDVWFLSCLRADGTGVCVRIEGRLTQIEERDAPKCGRCSGPIPLGAPNDGPYLRCPACGWSARGSRGLRA